MVRRTSVVVILLYYKPENRDICRIDMYCLRSPDFLVSCFLDGVDNRNHGITFQSGAFPLSLEAKPEFPFSPYRRKFVVVGRNIRWTLSAASAFCRWQIAVWRVGWSLFCQSPLTGHGPGSFEALYMLAQGEFLRNYPGQDGILAGNNRYAFNECLHIACETGLAGILTGAGLLLLLYISGNRKAAAYLWSGLLSVLVFACFSYPFSFLTFQVVVVGLGALLMSGRQRKIPLAGRIPFAVAIGLLLLSGGKEYILREKAERFMRKWHSASTSALYKQEAAKWYARLPASADFVLYYGRQLYLCGDYQKATEVLQQALQLRPCSGVAADLGDCYFRCGKYPEAENMLKKAVDVVPSSFNTRYRLFCFYRDTGQTLKAGQMAEEIAAMKMKVVNTTTLRIRREIKNYLIR